MRPIRIGLVAAMLAAALVPATVMSASKKDPVSEASRKQGMAEAPAVVQRAGISCKIADARFVAKGSSSDKTVKGPVSFYEVDCDQGPGFILSAPAEGAVTANPCIQMNAQGGKSSLTCALPGNQDAKADVAPYVTAAGLTCGVKDVRFIGQSQTNGFFEVACDDGAGYVIATNVAFDPAQKVAADNCLNFDEQQTPMTCKLSPKEARLAALDRYVAASNRSCTVKDRRYVAATQDHGEVFETSCTDGKGYMFKVASGKLAQSWNCAEAQGILGGCTLTDARAAMTEQAGLYTRLAKSAGSNCDVGSYAVFPAPQGKDVVELVCKDGSGGVGIFEAGGKGVVYDCAHALVAGYKCGLNKTTNFDSLTADLRKFDAKTCTVSDSRLASKTTKGTILLEVACSDGLKGYVIEYKDNPVTAVGATNCAFAGGCKLKGNT